MTGDGLAIELIFRHHSHDIEGLPEADPHMNVEKFSDLVMLRRNRHIPWCARGGHIERVIQLHSYELVMERPDRLLFGQPDFARLEEQRGDDGDQAIAVSSADIAPYVWPMLASCDQVVSAPRCDLRS